MNDDDGFVAVDPQATGTKERQLFQNQDERYRELQIQAYRDHLKYREEYFQSAKMLAETWVGFVIVMTIFQLIKPFGMKFEQYEFIAIAVTSLGTVVGLWWQVGKGMFAPPPDLPPPEMRK